MLGALSHSLILVATVFANYFTSFENICGQGEITMLKPTHSIVLCCLSSGVVSA